MNDCTAGVCTAARRTNEQRHENHGSDSPIHGTQRQHDGDQQSPVSGSIISDATADGRPGAAENRRWPAAPRNNVASSMAEPVLVCNTITHQMAYCTILGNSEERLAVVNALRRITHARIPRWHCCRHRRHRVVTFALWTAARAVSSPETSGVFRAVGSVVVLLKTYSVLNSSIPLPKVTSALARRAYACDSSNEPYPPLDGRLRYRDAGVGVTRRR